MPELRFPEHINYLTEKTLMLSTTQQGKETSASVADTNKAIHSRIMEVFDSAANNERQILNQRIHQLK